ncbi:MAG: nuclease [Roseomonas sp.]|nr:nuclease [Roseomonas sp.]
MSQRRSVAPWVAVIAAVAALLGAGQITDAGLERLARAAWQAIGSLNEPERPAARRASPRAAHSDGTPLAGHARIIDGDTLDIGETRIRMRGIDALEHDQRCSRPGDSDYECGKLARDALVVLIRGAAVTCVPDGSETYGRVVATCSVPKAGGGVVDLNAAMVRSGLAFDCARFSGRLYADEESAAKRAKSGAWAGRFDFPWVHRGRANACGRD